MFNSSICLKVLNAVNGFNFSFKLTFNLCYSYSFSYLDIDINITLLCVFCKMTKQVWTHTYGGTNERNSVDLIAHSEGTVFSC